MLIVAMTFSFVLLAALMSFAANPPPEPKLQTVDPKSILFSIPTVSDDIALVEPVGRQRTSTDIVFHEDDWSQVEFLRKESVSEVQRILKEYKLFELSHRTRNGWRKLYVRKIKRFPLLTSHAPVQQLEKLLGIKAGPAPLLSSSGTILGRVKNGFTLGLGKQVALYGYTAGEAIPVLGATLGRDPDEAKLTQAFMKLNSSSGLVLVDWRAQLVLVSVSSSHQVEVWRP